MTPAEINAMDDYSRGISNLLIALEMLLDHAFGDHPLDKNYTKLVSGYHIEAIQEVMTLARRSVDELSRGIEIMSEVSAKSAGGAQ